MKILNITINRWTGKLVIGIRRSAYLLLGTADELFVKSNSLITVISYHSVCDDDWRFSIDTKVVKKQIKYLLGKYNLITLNHLHGYLNGEVKITRPSVVLTFDDGYKDVLSLKNLFEKEKVKPALFLLSDSGKANYKELNTRREFLSKVDIKSLIKSGWEIGSHSSTHANLANISSKHLQYEVIESKKKLEKDLGIPIRYFAYPRGKYTEDVLNHVKKAGYDLALTMDDSVISENTNPFKIPRVGVDRTHSFAEFKKLLSVLNVNLRALVKRSFIGGII